VKRKLRKILDDVDNLMTKYKGEDGYATLVFFASYIMTFKVVCLTTGRVDLYNNMIKQAKEMVKGSELPVNIPKGDEANHYLEEVLNAPDVFFNPKDNRPNIYA
jgi:hypothetical protein